MSDYAITRDRFFDLVGTTCDEGASADDLAELDSMVRADREVREYYLGYCGMHSALRLELRAHRTTQAVFQQIGIKPSVSGSSTFQAATVETPAYPGLAFPASVWHGTVTYFSSGWPLAYLIATVTFTTGLFIGHLIPASQPEQIARRSLSTQGRSLPEPEARFVGQITGMVDCRWADKATEPALGTSVPLGRKYSLASGLMEVTYDTGAKVILQGPVTYEVEANGGYLAVGKLTGKLEKKAEGEARRAEEQVASGQRLSALRSPLFTEAGCRPGVPR